MQVFDTRGRFQRSFGSRGSLPAEFRSPTALAMDRDGNLYVCDRDNLRIQIFNAHHEFVTAFDGHAYADIDGQERLTFAEPFTVCVDSERRIFVSDGHKTFCVFGFPVSA